MNNIGIIIPTYNEEKNIGKLVDSIKSFVPNSEIFVVDDSINDLTKGNLSINSLRPIEIEDLLGRIAVEPNYALLKDSIENLNFGRTETVVDMDI